MAKAKGLRVEATWPRLEGLGIEVTWPKLGGLGIEATGHVHGMQVGHALVCCARAMQDSLTLLTNLCAMLLCAMFPHFGAVGLMSPLTSLAGLGMSW